MQIIIVFFIIVIFCLIGCLTYITQCQIQKLVEDVNALRYDIQEVRKKIVNKQNRGNLK